MNFDENISPLQNRACGFCHMPYAGFSGPIPSVNLTMVAYPGSYEFRAGKRTAQRYTYAPFFPVLNYNETQGLFFGGNFWDSRATGYLLGSPDAEQAQHPPVDTQEHALPDTACIAYRLTTAAYRPLFETVWGSGSLNINFPANTEQICDTPGSSGKERRRYAHGARLVFRYGLHRGVEDTAIDSCLHGRTGIARDD
jgi:cytochrome c peroxidase